MNYYKYFTLGIGGAGTPVAGYRQCPPGPPRGWLEPAGGASIMSYIRSS